MTPRIDFFVEGTPAPGGSKTVMFMRRRGGALIFNTINGLLYPVFNLVDAGGKRLKEWRKQVRIAAKEAFPFAPYDIPLRVCMEFVLQRPQDHHVGNDRSRPLKDWAREAEPEGPPDTTKLVRGTEDELTGVLWVDDSRITEQFNRKRYANPGERTGCRIVVTSPIPDHMPETLFTAEASAQ